KIKKDAPAPVAVLSPQSSQVHEFKGHKPTYDSHFETARGNLCHDILSDFITIDNEKKIDPLYDKYSKLYEFDFDKAKIIKAIKAFVNLPAVKSLFSNEADRAIKTEMEFTDKNGSLRRMDRVIIDKDKITVMDFKTGAESDGYQKQMTEYMAILSEVYKKPVEGFIGYIDLKKIVNVED
ncbi:MAG: PD-(D/E)XK nuclease family protein, partial [Elusimicrobiota bacterium]|nr:PD-(D/E)XK nuclease family protein [Elusimicrobiota bacterium]